MDGWVDGRTSGRADELAGGRTGRRADGGEQWADRGGRTGGRGGGRADGGEQWADRGGRTGGRVGELADWWTGGRGRTGGRRIFEGKTPNLTRHLTWLWEIQRGHPLVTVKLPDLPPPSR